MKNSSNKKCHVCDELYVSTEIFPCLECLDLFCINCDENNGFCSVTCENDNKYKHLMEHTYDDRNSETDK